LNFATIERGQLQIPKRGLNSDAEGVGIHAKGTGLVFLTSLVADDPALCIALPLVPSFAYRLAGGNYVTLPILRLASRRQLAARRISEQLADLLPSALE
jgi:hypothetical protein